MFLRNYKYELRDNRVIQFLYLSACQKLMNYNRQALKVYITEARPRLEIELD
jgi:hypothetical protein